MWLSILRLLVYPRDGHMLGISLSYNGRLVLILIPIALMIPQNSLLQQLFDEKTVVFHNAKFDMAFFEYHFNFKFPSFEDTMLLHYLIDENPGGHGLNSCL
jgi:DNA polymerase I-like protein with 3'-5' exonuclease and polymerase domains